MTSDVLPAHVGVRFTHACLQVLADDHGIDLLHIKGPAVDESLLDQAPTFDPDVGSTIVRRMPRHSVDADILVRPSHVKRLFDVISRHGWRMAFDFVDGSAFEHASTWEHPVLEHVDVHRQFPGIGLHPEAAFEALWDGRRHTRIAGQSCPVPDVTAQRLILILHAVRSGDLLHSDIRNAWTLASDEQRRSVDALAVRLHAQVALAAGTGRLEAHRDSREYDLWKVLSSGDPSLARLWLARVKAQPTPGQAVRMGLKLVLPNRNRLAHRLGHRPGVEEMAAEYLKRVKTAAAELGRLVGLVTRRVSGAGRR